MRKKLIFGIIVLICVIAVAVATVDRISMTAVQDCKTVEWATEEPAYGTCQYAYNRTVCDDYPINNSCHVELYYDDYPCQTGTNTIPHSEKQCTTEAYEIKKEEAGIATETGRINFKNWGECSYVVEEPNIIITCDSRHDGNNDGICQSGESCVRFMVTPDAVERLVKNSRNDFTAEDTSFFLEKLSYEVEE